MLAHGSSPPPRCQIPALKERIKLETEALKFLALLTVGMGGGSISLVLGERTFLRLGLAAVGRLATIVLGVFSWRHYRWLQQETDKEDAQ